MVYSASMVKALDAGKPATDFFTDQLLYVVFGAACALFLWKVVPYRFWVGPIVWAVWAVAVALIFAVWLAGTDHYGAQRWLYIGPIGLQPSEFCKIAFILVAVRLVVDWWAGLVESRATMVRALIFIIAPIALMYRTQSDLGTTAICFVGILAVMWMGGVSRRVIFACLGVAVLGWWMAGRGTPLEALRSFRFYEALWPALCGALRAAVTLPGRFSPSELALGALAVLTLPELLHGLCRGRDLRCAMILLLLVSAAALWALSGLFLLPLPLAMALAWVWQRLCDRGAAVSAAVPAAVLALCAVSSILFMF